MALSENELKTEAWKRAIEACGTGAIFARRALRIGRLGKLRDFLGIFIPVCVGIIVADVSLGSKHLALLIELTALPSLVQAGLSIWSLVAGWNENYTKCIASQVRNNALRREWEAFGRGMVPATQPSFDVVDVKTTDQEQIDLALNPSEKERRYGMRYALREFNRACASCNKIPQNMEASDCGTCGRF